MPPREEPWKYRLYVSDIVAWNAKQCKTDVETGEILLMLNALVDGDEDVEIAGYATKQLAVLVAAQTSIGYR